MVQLADKQKELADYQAETIKVIRGESRLDIDLLNDLVSKTKQEIQTLAATVEAAKLELEQHLASSDLERQEYEKIKDWADLYGTCTFAAKKMIICPLYKAHLQSCLSWLQQDCIQIYCGQHLPFLHAQRFPHYLKYSHTEVS